MKVFDTYVKTQKCHPRDYYEKQTQAKNQALENKYSKSRLSSNIRTRRSLCIEGYQGQYFSDGSCNGAPDIQIFKDDMAKAADLEYADYDKKWHNKDLTGICAEFNTVPHSKGCLFKKGGAKNNNIDAGVRFYLANRKVKQQQKAIKDLKRSMASYNKLSPQQRAAQFNQETGLTVIPKTVTQWEEASALCQSKGLNLPSSDDLIQHKTAIMGYKSAQDRQLNEYMASAVNDKLGYQTLLAVKLGKTEVMPPSSRHKLVICKAMSAAEKQQLANKKALEEVQIAKFGASTPLEYWQKIMLAKNNDELKTVFEYSPKVNKQLGNHAVNFKYDQFFNHRTLLDGGDYQLSQYTQERSSNIFLWAMKPNSSQLDHYVDRLGKRIKTSYGLTNKGLDSFIAQLKQQPLFNTLTDRKIENKDYFRKIHGNFKDADGKTHTVTILLRPTYYRIFIDSSSDE